MYEEFEFLRSFPLDLCSDRAAEALSLSGRSGPETKGFFKSVLPPIVEVVTDVACRGMDLAIGDIFK